MIFEAGFGGERAPESDGVFVRGGEIAREFDLLAIDFRAEIFRTGRDPDE